MKFFAYACLILGAAAVKLDQRMTVETQALSDLQMGMQVSLSLASYLKEDGIEEDVKKDLEKAFEDDGKLSWPEAEAIIKKYMPHIIDHVVDEAVKHGHDRAKVEAWVAAHREELEAHIIAWFHHGFNECDENKDGFLSGKELQKCTE